MSIKTIISSIGSNVGSLLEADGKWSAMRFMSMFAVIVPISVWAIISLVNWQPAQLPAEVSAIVLFGLGGKALQSKYEIQNARESVTGLLNMTKPTTTETNQYSLYSDNSQQTNYPGYDPTMENTNINVENQAPPVNPPRIY
jgi:hypothetical protein